MPDYSAFNSACNAALANSGLTGSDQDYGVGAMKVGADGTYTLNEYVYPENLASGIEYMYNQGCDFGQNPDNPKPPPPPPSSLIQQL